jgi:hypothetical protein
MNIYSLLQAPKLCRFGWCRGSDGAWVMSHYLDETPREADHARRCPVRWRSIASGPWKARLSSALEGSVPEVPGHRCREIRACFRYRPVMKKRDSA